MQINADLKDGVYTLRLSGAPAGSVVEVRFQNTINGVSEVYTVDAGADGSAAIQAPRNFGQNFKVEATVLTAANEDSTQGLVYAPVAKDDTSGNFVLVTGDSPLLQSQQQQPAAQQPAQIASVPLQPARTATQQNTPPA